MIHNALSKQLEALAQAQGTREPQLQKGKTIKTSPKRPAPLEKLETRANAMKGTKTRGSGSKKNLF